MEPRYATNPDIAYRIIDDHVFAITPDTRQHELNGEVELLVWRLCEEKPRSKQELLSAVLNTFDVKPSTATGDLDSFLSELINASLFITR